MSIIIQAGHKTSKSKEVMEKLYERGLSKPSDSYTHKMTTEQVSETLYKVLARENMLSANEKMADNVMTDFLLANLDAENWGWESDKNLASLEYWQQIEPDVGFVLVFDHPKNILKEFTNETLTADTIDQVMSEWVDYHQKMLEILEVHEDKAILIEGICAADNISKLGEQVKPIASGLNLKKHWQVFKDATDSVPDNDTDTVNQSNAAIDHINNEILKKYTEVIKLFNTLLNKAAIKSSEPIYRTKQADLTELVTVLNDLYDKRENSQHSVEKELLVEQLHDVQKQLESQLSAHEVYKQQKTKDHILLEKKLEDAVLAQEVARKRNVENEKKVVQYKSELKKSREKNEVINKVDQVADKEKNLINKIANENKDFLDFSNEVCKKRTKSLSLNDNRKKFGAGVRVKNSKEYITGKSIIDICNNPKNIFNIHIIYKENKRKIAEEENKLKSLPDLSSYEDYHEVEKLKDHLSYKIGKEIFTDRKYKFIKLPVLLLKHTVDHKKNTRSK